jgi:hypothetical protein
LLKLPRVASARSVVGRGPAGAAGAGDTRLREEVHADQDGKRSDAEASLRLLGRLDHETQFMMYEPEERTTTVEAQGESLRDILITGNSTVLLAK